MNTQDKIKLYFNREYNLSIADELLGTLINDRCKELNLTEDELLFKMITDDVKKSLTLLEIEKVSLKLSEYYT